MLRWRTSSVWASSISAEIVRMNVPELIDAGHVCRTSMSDERRDDDTLTAVVDSIVTSQADFVDRGGNAVVAIAVDGFGGLVVANSLAGCFGRGVQIS